MLSSEHPPESLDLGKAKRDESYPYDSVVIYEFGCSVKIDAVSFMCIERILSKFLSSGAA